MNKGAFCQARGGLGRPERRRVGWGGGVQSGTSMNVPSVPSDIALPCLLSQQCLKKREKRVGGGPQGGVQRVPGWRKRWAVFEEVSGKPGRVGLASSQ